MLLKRLISLGLAHGLADATTGFVLFTIPGFNLFGKITAALIFGILAFGFQPIAGILTDKYIGAKWSVIGGLGAILIGALIAIVHPLTGVILMGVGSGFFHVGAGASAIRLTPNKSYGPGIFTAPGVLGLGLGISFALVDLPILPVLIILLLAVLVLNFVFLPKTKSFLIAKTSVKFDNKLLVGLLLALVFAVMVRSSLWDSFQNPKVSIPIFLGLAAAAFVGKLFGSLLADRIGAVLFIIVVGIIAALGLVLGNFSIWWLVLGVLALQSTTPFVLMLIGRMISKNIATATGLILGLAIALGALVGLVVKGYTSYFAIPAVVGVIIISAILFFVVKQVRA